MAVFNVFNPLENVTPRFTEEQLQDFIKWFDENAKPSLTLDDGPPINVITIAKFQDFFGLQKFHRRNFHYPSYGEIMKEAEFLKAGVTRLLTKEQFIYILNKWVIEPEIKHELILAFQVFDTENRKFLGSDEIKTIVSTYSDTFTEDEVIEMLRDADVRGDGNVYYEEFVESLFSLAPQLYEIKATYLYDNPDEDPSVPPLPEPEPEVIVPPAPPQPPPSKNTKKKK